MAKLNFPDPTLVQTYTEAGITWTWNATLEVWSAEPGNGFDEAVADGRYLSKLTNDTAAGEITFQQNIIVDNRIGVGIESPERSLDVDGAVKLGSPDGTGIIILGRNEVTPEDNWHIGASDGKFEIWSGLLGSGDSKFTVEDDQINSRKLFIAEEDVNVVGKAPGANIFTDNNQYLQFGGNNRTLATFAVDINNVGNGAYFGGDSCQLSTSEPAINLIRSVYKNGGHGGGQNLALINNSVEVDTAAQRVCLYQAESGAQQSGKLYGYYSGISKTDSSDQAYNFYAAGDAQNYFEGDIQCGGFIETEHLKGQTIA